MIFQPIGNYAGMRVLVKDAQQQMRTARDVRGPWVRPGRVPSKLKGRKGTRRMWKRAHVPGWTWLYREPADVLIIDKCIMVVTPAQWASIKVWSYQTASGLYYGGSNSIFNADYNVS